MKTTIHNIYNTSVERIGPDYIDMAVLKTMGSISEEIRNPTEREIVQTFLLGRIQSIGDKEVDDILISEGVE